MSALRLQPKRAKDGRIINAMSVDVEEFFQVGAFETCINKADWDGFDSRVAASTNEILDVFEAAGVKSTFFCLGWVAERQADLIKRIVAEGHELASHGYDHARVFHLTEAAFREDLKRTQAILEDIGGVKIQGYRAPSFSIDKRCPWAHGVLAELGYRYSSSVYPIQHDHYGMPDAPRAPYIVDGLDLVEIPMSTIELAGKRWPSAGGGFFRLLPYIISRRMIERVNEKDGVAATFYMHPWEIDTAQPVQYQAPLRSRFRHYVNLSKTKGKLIRLLKDFHWDRMDALFLQSSQRAEVA